MTTYAELKVPFVDLKAQFASIQTEIADSINSVLHSAQFIGGQWVERFEEQFARSVGARYAVGVSSGTAALELSLKCLQVGGGDEVIVPANTFFATAEAVSNVGARPVFADVDKETFHLDIDSVQRVTTGRTRAIIPVHLYGQAMDITALQEFADANRLAILEDAAQAHGVQHGGIPVGGSGRLTCFSFYPGKNLGAYGDAGAVTCNDSHQAEQLRLLRDHGSPAKYVHSVIGTNSRLDAIQAAVLSVKLPHLAEWNSRRVNHARSYDEKLQGSSVQAPPIPVDGEHNFHLFVVRVDNRDDLKQYLQQHGIEVGIHYPVPLHLTAAYQQMRHPGKGSLPVAEMLAGEILSLPMYPELTEGQIDWVTETIFESLSAASTMRAETCGATQP